MKKILGYLSGLFKGRLARLDYFTSQFAFALMAFVLILPFAIINSILSFLTTLTGTNLNFIGTFINIIFSSIVTVAFILFYLLIVSSIIRRGHDIGWSGLFTVCMSVIGIVIIIPYLFLLFKKSDKEENKYGVLNRGGYWKRLLNI